MSMFDDDLNSQFSFKITLKPKLKMITTQSDDPVDQEDVIFNMFNDQQNQFKSQNTDVNKQIELVKLRVQQLQLKLQIKRLAASLNFNLNSSQRTSTFLI